MLNNVKIFAFIKTKELHLHHNKLSGKQHT